jgi:pimeloyl-ACP methyl ester carboxylesterase
METLAASVLSQVSGSFILAGLSMGGYVALEILRQAPERVIGLALVDTQAGPDSPQASEGRRALIERSTTDFEGVIETLYPRLVHPARAEDDSLKDLFRDMAFAVGADAFTRQQRAIMNRIDSRPFLPQIACPTLVLCGRNDAVTPVAVHDEMASAIVGSRMEVIAECGHLSAIEKPAAVTTALTSWLKTL